MEPEIGKAGVIFLDKNFSGRKVKSVKRNQIWLVLRDVIIVTVLSCLGGFIVGFTSTDHSSPLYFNALALSNSLFCIIGFTISGCLAVGNRWRHMAFVAAIVWAVSIFNVIFFGLTTIQWAASVVAIAIFALIGGGISLLFKRKTLVEISSNAGDDKFYDEVARELQEKPMVAGLWTKAFAEMGGDDAKARALYIKYRVAQLAEASCQQREQRRAKIKAAEEQQRAEIEAAERRARTRFHRVIHWIVGSICVLLTLVSGFAGIGCIITVFTEKDLNSDDLVGVIVGTVFSFFICYLCVLGTRHCHKEIQ